MTSLRVRIVQRIRDLLSQLDGWSVQIATHPYNPSDPDADVHAFVDLVGEEKSTRNTMTYAATVQVHVVILAKAEDADPDEHDSNALVYLDSLAVAAERALAPPDAMTTVPGASDLRFQALEIEPPDENSLVQAVLRLTVNYQHNLTDPETFNPYFVT